MCAALHKIRPCTPAESMAYLYLHTDGLVVDYVPGPDDEQQNYMDNSREFDKAKKSGSAKKREQSEVASSSLRNRVTSVVEKEED